MRPQSVLFVCVGNICRSPMAHNLFVHQTNAFQTDSAGLSALVGANIDPLAQQALLNLYQLNAEPHVAKQLNLNLVRQYDLILTMSARQNAQLLQQWPVATGKVFRLGHWLNLNIADPFGKTQNEFNQCCELIHTCVTDWISHLQ